MSVPRKFLSSGRTYPIVHGPHPHHAVIPVFAFGIQRNNHLVLEAFGLIVKTLKGAVLFSVRPFPFVTDVLRIGKNDVFDPDSVAFSVFPLPLVVRSVVFPKDSVPVFESVDEIPVVLVPARKRQRSATVRPAVFDFPLVSATLVVVESTARFRDVAFPDGRVRSRILPENGCPEGLEVRNLRPFSVRGSVRPLVVRFLGRSRSQESLQSEYLRRLFIPIGGKPGFPRFRTFQFRGEGFFLEPELPVLRVRPLELNLGLASGFRPFSQSFPFLRNDAERYERKESCGDEGESQNLVLLVKFPVTFGQFVGVSQYDPFSIFRNSRESIAEFIGKPAILHIPAHLPTYVDNLFLPLRKPFRFGPPGMRRNVRIARFGDSVASDRDGSGHEASCRSCRSFRRFHGKSVTDISRILFAIFDSGNLLTLILIWL